MEEFVAAAKIPVLIYEAIGQHNPVKRNQINLTGFLRCDCLVKDIYRIVFLSWLHVHPLHFLSLSARGL